LDLLDKDELSNLIKTHKPMYFAHLGSESSAKKTNNKGEDTHESIYVTSKNIIDSIEKFSKDTIFFFPSSATIYEGYINTNVNEKTVPKPKTNYSLARYAAQQYIEEKIEISNLQLNNGIMFSHESEFRRPNFFTKQISQFLVEYKKKGELKLEVGDLSLERDIGYAKDYVDAVYQIMLANKRTNFIISSNKLYSLSYFIDTCLNFLDIDYEVIKNKNHISYIDKNTNYEFIKSTKNEYREYDLRGIKGDNSKIFKNLGWSPKKELEEICKIMITYDLKNN